MVLHLIDAFLVSSFPSVPADWVGAVFWSGLAFCVMLGFEMACWKDVQRLRCSSANKKGGKELHNAALVMNVVNHLILGPITYHVTIHSVCQPTGSLTLVQQVIRFVGLLAVEGTLYYWIHRSFHEVPGLYWMHRFHHKFHGDLVLPSSANAVSVFEFVFAYMLPFPVGAWLCGCDKWSTLAGATVVCITNLYIHTPPLKEALSFLPWIFVSPADHLQHHRKIRSNYAAPVFHLDRILQALSLSSSSPPPPSLREPVCSPTSGSRSGAGSEGQM